MCAASMLGAGQAAYGEQSTEMFGDFTAYYIHQDNAYFTDQNKASFVEPIVRVGARAQASEHISLTMRGVATAVSGNSINLTSVDDETEATVDLWNVEFGNFLNERMSLTLGQR